MKIASTGEITHDRQEIAEAHAAEEAAAVRSAGSEHVDMALLRGACLRALWAVRLAPTTSSARPRCAESCGIYMAGGNCCSGKQRSADE